jgi:hypothetical protein
MIKNKIQIAGIIAFWANSLFAQNPIIHHQFSADPSARVYGDSVFLYPSHDIKAKPGQGRAGWFCMEDYHVFSSADLTNWTDHGVIVSQDKIEWANPAAYSLWAPDCISRNGRYYFYFPAPAKDTIYGRGFSIGLAISGNPAGPFIPEASPILKAHGIDPCPFIDKDGQGYLYWAMGKLYVAKMKENLLELASEPQIVSDLPDKGLVEGPYLFERNGIYYMTYPHVQNRIERLEYAIGMNPMGPFKFAGVIMDESPMNCWTNHQSVIEYKGQWYLFYHQNEFSPNFDKNRSVCIDSLFFNGDGTIRKVIPSHRGVGLTSAIQKIEPDRYSQKSESGTTVSFIDTLNTFAGWKTIFSEKNAWIRYNTVDFGKSKLKTVMANVLSNTGGTLEIRSKAMDGAVIATIAISGGEGWRVVSGKVTNYPTGIHDLFVTLKTDGPVEIDWLSFK